MTKPSAPFTRRKFLLTAGATTLGAVLLKGCTQSNASNPQTSNIAGVIDQGSGQSARIGFVGQTDAAPLIIAQAKGFFAKHGVPDVKLLKQPSWGVTRDNLELGSAGGGLDGAMVLSPLPYQMSLGTVTKGKKQIPMYIVARLNIDGQGISVSNAHKDIDVSLDTSKLKAKADQAKADKKPLRFGMTFKGGTSDTMLRYWLASGGIDPDKDVSVLVVPGPQLVSNVRVGNLDGFCVGDPWNERLVREKLGYTAIVTGEFWKNHPEKALSFRADWMDKNPQTAKGILKAVLEAQQWCDNMENREELCKILAQRKWAKVKVDYIEDRLKGKVNYGNDRQIVENSPYLMRYWNDNASYPYQSHDLWFLTENIRWGNLPPTLDTKAIIKAVNREDLWREAAKEIGVAAADIPISPSKGIETFFDGVTFDPENPQAYLDSLKIKNIKQV
ncbi:ABC transporter substrate-binding protein [Microcoleus sp. FACHB-831]|uniref:CmpA/NrtA family ABC transporter substrate-binding protein n=1 Tax=Microcoleus sp. FACHB-831 TaxID=2692827 RepID=UPI0016859518|nr:CmpA/NrtA family ABC transporter substrate-binding protein [Microcoleus sp. FACHB-831]MBD1922694.1 ABC transporter substrate-binding protein [Microcoleus sp. FACHB-831]